LLSGTTIFPPRLLSAGDDAQLVVFRSAAATLSGSNFQLPETKEALELDGQVL